MPGKNESGKFKQDRPRLVCKVEGFCFLLCHVNIKSMNRKFSLNGEKTSKGFPFIGKLSNMPLQRQNKRFIPLIEI